MKLNSIDPITELVRSLGISTWEDLREYIAKIPYGRTSDRKKPELVLLENKGTCSSKHALLKLIADKNDIEAVELILGMYKMNADNTPGIGSVLQENGLDYIPEAHCYLKVNGKREDWTNLNTQIEKMAPDILEEITIQPNQIGAYKVTYHKNFLNEWRLEQNVSLPLEELWTIRETCIAKLSEM